MMDLFLNVYKKITDKTLNTLQGHAILVSTNDVDKVNDVMLSMLLGEIKKYLSA